MIAILQGDARHLPLPSGCVDLVVTSPPYFGLRSYTDGCPTCAEEARKANCGYRARYCPRCDLTTARLRCNGCQGATTELEKKPPARSDCPDCGGTGQRHYEGQIGSEATPQEWLAAMVDCTREMVRVLKPEGSIFINLGDKYVADNRGSGADVKRGQAKYAPAGPQGYLGREMARHKSLLGLPWRYALACTDQLGLILRRDIIWAKPNGLPESVTDRCRSAHEYVFHLVKQPRYYSAVDEIREPQVSPVQRTRTGVPVHRSLGRQGPGGPFDQTKPTFPVMDEPNPLGKLPGSVWSIPSQPLTVPASVGVDHFAAFPVELPRRIVLGWSPPGVCVACGQGRRPVVDRGPDVYRRPSQHVAWTPPGGKSYGESGRLDIVPDYRITGYVCACPSELTCRLCHSPRAVGTCQQVLCTCSCHHLPPPAPTRPAVVLDPFAGTGTTLLAAAAYGRHAIGIDRSADYCRLATWRVNDPGERAKAMQVPKPPPIPDGMEALF